MGVLSGLKREQKEAIGLLQIGTFLEYFDLMLYVHMAVLLNDLFFPKADPQTAALLTAFAFCSTYVLRPFGALIFGWVGDNIGRKATVIITTTMMAVSCIVMANLPTYVEIGITAAWIVTICRIIQGMSSMGEIIGAQIYVTEITQHPQQYAAVSFIGIASAVGGVAALGTASLVTHLGFNWRVAFWLGACIAVVGSIARTRLRETPEFLAVKLRKKARDQALIKENKLYGKTLLAFFLIFCGWPLTFYLAFMYFHPVLKGFGYSAEDIILHNFYLSLIFLLSLILNICMTYRIHPLKIIKVRALLSLPLIVMLPFLITQCTSPFHLFILQSTLILLSLSSSPAEALLFKTIPVIKRVTFSSFLYALSRALMYVVTSFSLVFFVNKFGNIALLMVILPVTFGFIWGVRYLECLENVQKDMQDFYHLLTITRKSRKLSPVMNNKMSINPDHSKAEACSVKIPPGWVDPNLP